MIDLIARLHIVAASPFAQEALAASLIARAIETIEGQREAPVLAFELDLLATTTGLASTEDRQTLLDACAALRG